MRILQPHKDLFTRTFLILIATFLLLGTSMAQTFVSNGTATLVSASPNVINCRLTQDITSENGNIWYTKKIDLRFPFKMVFTVNLGNKSLRSGADGIAFVIHQDANGTAAMGGGGGAIGYGSNGSIRGITPSLAIEYDTYYNDGADAYDPYGIHMALMKNGDQRHRNNYPSPISNLAGPVMLGSVADNVYHDCTVSWDPATQNLTGTFDNKTFTYTGDIIANTFSSNSAVYFGFTGSTGASTNQQSVSFDLSRSVFTEIVTTSRPSIVSITSTADLCTGTNAGTATITAINGTQPYSITVGTVVHSGIYSNTGTQSASSLFTNLSPGTYAVTVTDASGLQASSSVTIDPAPASPTIFNVSGGGTICSTLPITEFPINLSGSQLGVNYYLYKNSAQIGTAIAGTGAPISFLTSGVGSYSIIAKNNAGNNCSSNMNGQAMVIKSTLPNSMDITIITNNHTNQHVLCSNNNATLNVPSSGNSTWTYVWRNGSTLLSGNTDNNIIDAQVITGAGVYEVTATDQYGCSVTSAPITITVDNTIPTITANGSTTVCAPGSVSLTADASGSSYLWNTGETSQSINATASGDYSYSVTTVNGCSVASAAAAVTINPLPAKPVITVPNPVVFCGPQTLKLTATNGSNYSWTMTVATAAQTKSAELIATLGVGTNTFTVANTSIDGCVSTSAPVTILVKATPITYTVSGDHTFCLGNGVSTINLNNSEATATYELFNNGASIGLKQIGTGGAINFTAPSAVGTNVYTIVATNNLTNCVAQMSGSATIIINPLPSVPAITYSINAVCVGSSIQLQNAASGGNWTSVNSSIASIDGNGNVTGINAGVVQIGYSVTNNTGCTYGAVTNVTVYPTPTKPTITANGPTSFCPKGSVILSSDVSIGNKWSISNATTQTTTVSNSGIYTNTVTNQYGCFAVSNTIIVDATDHNAPVPSIPGSSLPELKNIAMNTTVNAPTAMDDCDGTIMATTVNPVSYSKPGTYTIIWTYTDNSGNTSTQSQNLTVIDIIPPTIAVLPNIIQNAGKDSCSAVVNYQLPTINDNVSSTPISISEGYGDNSIVFDVPVTNSVSNLSFTSSGDYQDIAHGHGESINVTVSLYNPLTSVWTDIQTIQTGISDYHFGGTNTNFTAITQVSKIRFTASKVIGAALHFYNLMVNLNSIGLIQTKGLPSGSVFPVGKTTNTFTATDQAGNTSSTSFDITIVDAQKPVIQPINSISKFADATGSWKGSAASITILENCAGVSLNEQYFDANGNVIASKQSNNISLSYTLVAQIFPLGVNRVVLTATDAAGNVSDPVSFNLTVTDNTSPTIATVVSVTQSNDPGVCGAYVKVPTPLATDNVGLRSFTNDYTKGSTAVAYYPVGTTIITWTAIDMNGNATTATQSVTVNDTELPVFTSLPVDIAQTNDLDACTAIVTWPAVFVSDNCGAGSGATTLNIVADHHSGEQFPIGTTKVTYTATDIHGNVAKASFNVIVTDNQAPKAITQPKTVTLSNGIVTITAAEINNASYDNCGTVTLSLSKTNFTCNDIGLVPVLLTVTDQYGNSSTATAMVTVVGQTLASTISVIPSNSVYTGGNPTDIYIGYGPQSATIVDNVVGAVTNYSWSGSGLSCTNCAAPVFTALSTGLNNFSVTASNQYGCTTTSTVAFCVRDIRVSAAVNSAVSICHTDLNNGATSTLQMPVSQVATQLAQNPQDKLGACGLLPCTSNLITATVAAIEAVQIKSVNESAQKVDKLTVNVSPNPSNNVFVIVVNSVSKSAVSLRMSDINGRILETHQNIPLNSPIKIGGELMAGFYIAEVVQGNERVAVKLIKQNR